MRGDPEHMTGSPRRIRARIADIRRETPSVTSFWLDYGTQSYRFRPGQWVDLFVVLGPHERVGGYSITSTSSVAGRIRLAVKYSNVHPVTHWLCRHARVGDEVEVSEGQGDFFYDRRHGDRLILLAGGIGITPLIGILREIYESYPEVAATLFCSASESAELLFRQELDEIAAARANIHCSYTLTRLDGGERDGSQGRILQILGREVGIDTAATYYFCGPRGFVDDLREGLAARGVAEERMVFERWW